MLNVYCKQNLKFPAPKCVRSVDSHLQQPSCSHKFLHIVSTGIVGISWTFQMSIPLQNSKSVVLQSPGWKCVNYHAPRSEFPYSRALTVAMDYQVHNSACRCIHYAPATHTIPNLVISVYSSYQVSIDKAKWWIWRHLPAFTTYPVAVTLVFTLADILPFHASQGCAVSMH